MTGKQKISLYRELADRRVAAAEKSRSNPHAPAQATIDELRAEVERLTRDLQEMTDDRDSWLQQADDRAADALRFAKESEALKAKQIDVEAVMRVVEHMMRASWAIGTRGPEYNAAREALRASLLGDGGTL